MRIDDRLYYALLVFPLVVSIYILHFVCANTLKDSRNNRLPKYLIRAHNRTYIVLKVD